MHGHNPSYLAKLNIIEPDPFCPCGHQIPPIPTSRYRDHVFHICEIHEEHRPILSAVSQLHDQAILLGGTKGLLATAKFLKASGAFSANLQNTLEPPPLPELDLANQPGLPDPPERPDPP